MPDQPAFAAAALHHVFVYGTLKRGGENHRFLAGQSFLGPARTGPGWQLYQIDGYPGLVAETAAATPVVGEVWAVDGLCLRRLDALEGVNAGLYTRDRIALAPPFAATPVWTYLYARAVTGRPPAPPDWPVR